ncbi:hypothetical protein [Rothia aerolata]|uniref:Amidotransferase n=1 Tax=Rothia aerolata TaxID=1812262 RepID=A0A917IVD1_9MICC|nr:hypothetical protein [Rothia aerolata]GGH63702.1 hypothetical protein GCM10007359_15270 [Rothia aerolata]
MTPTVSGLLLMVFGAFFVGGAWSFRQQKLPLAVQIIMALVGLAIFGYGAYVMFAYN